MNLTKNIKINKKSLRRQTLTCEYDQKYVQVRRFYVSSVWSFWSCSPILVIFIWSSWIGQVNIPHIIFDIYRNNRLKRLHFTCKKYSGDLNSKLVQYSNGPKQFAPWMVPYSGHGLNSKLIVCSSGHRLFCRINAPGEQSGIDITRVWLIGWVTDGLNNDYVLL